MFKLIRWAFKIALLLIVAALLLDLKYQGKSAREYASEYGWKAASLVWGEAKKMKGKDLGDLPKSLPSLPDMSEKLKEVTNKLNANDPSKSKDETPSTSDHLSNKDREELKKLLENKAKN
ncbi:MAG: hypothetical protein HQM15_11015 [Deltaproteobacteria bacterium]|nr:hypothetical protein [Deltaproteobacteria bacterium]